MPELRSVMDSKAVVFSILVLLPLISASSSSLFDDVLLQTSAPKPAPKPLIKSRCSGGTYLPGCSDQTVQSRSVFGGFSRSKKPAPTRIFRRPTFRSTTVRTVVLPAKIKYNANESLFDTYLSQPQITKHKKIFNKNPKKKISVSDSSLNQNKQLSSKFPVFSKQSLKNPFSSQDKRTSQGTRTLSNEDLKALSNLLQNDDEEAATRLPLPKSSDNLLPFLDRIKKNRIKDLQLAMSILEIIEKSRETQYSNNTGSEELEKSLSKLLLEGDTHSFDNLPRTQRHTLETFMEKMQSSLGLGQISREFLLPSNDFEDFNGFNDYLPPRRKKPTSLYELPPAPAPIPSPPPRPFPPTTTFPPFPPTRPGGGAPSPPTRPRPGGGSPAPPTRPRPGGGAPAPPTTQRPGGGAPAPPTRPRPGGGSPAPPSRGWAPATAPLDVPNIQSLPLESEEHVFLTSYFPPQGSSTDSEEDNNMIYLAPGQNLDFSQEQQDNSNIWTPMTPNEAPSPPTSSRENTKHNFHYHYHSLTGDVAQEPIATGRSSEQRSPSRAMKARRPASFDTTSFEDSYSSVESRVPQAPVAPAPFRHPVAFQNLAPAPAPPVAPTSSYETPVQQVPSNSYRAPAAEPLDTYRAPQVQTPQTGYGPPPRTPVVQNVPTSYGPPRRPVDTPSQSYRAPVQAAPSMSYRAPQNPPANPHGERTRVVFLSPMQENRGRGKGRSKGRKRNKNKAFSSFSVLFDDSQRAPPQRNPGSFDYGSDEFYSQRDALRDEYWRSRERLFYQQQQAFNLEQLSLEIALQEKQRKELKNKFLKGMFKHDKGMKGMFYKGAMALGAMSLLPFASFVGRRRRRRDLTPSGEAIDDFHRTISTSIQSFENKYKQKSKR